MANKRIANILRQADGQYTSNPIDTRRFTEDAERGLANQILQLEKQVTPLLLARDYQRILTLLASLRDNVDRFFDDVMVMVEEAKLRENRLNLLSQLRGLFLKVGDISKLHIG